jgi:hypothetical protein
MRYERVVASLLAAAFSTPVLADDVTYRKQIRPLIKAQCDECHGPNSPTLAEFKLDEEKYKKAKEGPRTDTYDHLIALVGWPDTGALMRRLDDGANTPDGKPGNMYKHLGETDSERAANLAIVKAWVGEDAWKLNRWRKRGDVPAITKEEMERLKLRY